MTDIHEPLLNGRWECWPMREEHIDGVLTALPCPPSQADFYEGTVVFRDGDNEYGNRVQWDGVPTPMDMVEWALRVDAEWAKMGRRLRLCLKCGGQLAMASDSDVAACLACDQQYSREVLEHAPDDMWHALLHQRRWEGVDRVVILDPDTMELSVIHKRTVM